MSHLPLSPMNGLKKRSCCFRSADTLFPIYLKKDISEISSVYVGTKMKLNTVKEKIIYFEYKKN